MAEIKEGPIFGGASKAAVDALLRNVRVKAMLEEIRYSLCVLTRKVGKE